VVILLPCCREARSGSGIRRSSPEFRTSIRKREMLGWRIAGVNTRSDIQAIWLAQKRALFILSIKAKDRRVAAIVAAACSLVIVVIGAAIFIIFVPRHHLRVFRTQRIVFHFRLVGTNAWRAVLQQSPGDGHIRPAHRNKFFLRRVEIGLFWTVGFEGLQPKGVAAWTLHLIFRLLDQFGQGKWLHDTVISAFRQADHTIIDGIGARTEPFIQGSCFIA
jgi:hypothetical protein